MFKSSCETSGKQSSADLSAEEEGSHVPGDWALETEAVTDRRANQPLHSVPRSGELAQWPGHSAVEERTCGTFPQEPENKDFSSSGLCPLNSAVVGQSSMASMWTDQLGWAPGKLQCGPDTQIQKTTVQKSRREDGMGPPARGADEQAAGNSLEIPLISMFCLNRGNSGESRLMIGNFIKEFESA